MALERAGAETPLSFPGKILVDEAGKRLFVADSNHNRIVIADLNGRVLDVAGEGHVGIALLAETALKGPQAQQLDRPPEHPGRVRLERRPLDHNYRAAGQNCFIIS